MKGDILVEVVFGRENAPKWTFLYLVDIQHYIELFMLKYRKNDTFGVHKCGILTFFSVASAPLNATSTGDGCGIYRR